MHGALIPPDWPSLWAGLGCYALGTGLAVRGELTGRPWEGGIQGSVLLGAALFGVVIAQHWMRVGHGPFLSMFEILLSNLFSLGLIYGLVSWRVPAVRSGAVVVLPVLLLLALWVANAPPRSTRLPPTYENYWLWVHVLMGKLFLGTCLVGVGVAGVLLLRRGRATPLGGSTGGGKPGRGGTGWAPTITLDALAWRLMAVAFVFESMMLIAGAVWAQDAWGRYWDWDPLETWAFITWLALAGALHLRVTYRLARWQGWCMIIAVFILAFLTFFGVPFVSLAPHKGAV
jgi:ABC-type transport system involved in cytochrome c biogenesis permease subunit